jgi:hypothetical protein
MGSNDRQEGVARAPARARRARSDMAGGGCPGGARIRGQATFWRTASSRDFGTAPTTCSTTVPPLKSRSVGIPMIR